MKHLIFFLLTVISFSLSAQTEQGFITALKNINIPALEPYLKDNIDFCIFEDQQFLDKRTALKNYSDFLNGQKITSLEVIHKGSSKDNSSQYKVLKMNTSKGVYRIFVYSVGEIGNKNVKEIRIDKF